MPDTHASSDGVAMPGNDLKSAPFASVKIVLLTPTPSASVAIAPSANSGLRESDRRVVLEVVDHGAS